MTMDESLNSHHEALLIPIIIKNFLVCRIYNTLSGEIKDDRCYQENTIHELIWGCLLVCSCTSCANSSYTIQRMHLHRPIVNT
jgi:hypothetical protein